MNFSRKYWAICKSILSDWILRYIQKEQWEIIKKCEQKVIKILNKAVKKEKSIS